VRLNPGISGLENFRDPWIRKSRDPGIAIPNHITTITVHNHSSQSQALLGAVPRRQGRIHMEGGTRGTCLSQTHGNFLCMKMNFCAAWFNTEYQRS